MPAVQVYYYTDPACPWSWALEPAVRKLVREFGENLQFTYVMCGMAREFADPVMVAGNAMEAAAASGMPVDARLWLQSPPHSSFPACIAVKAAAEQGDPGPYLRRLREGLLCRRRKLDGTEALVEEAQRGGLDVPRLRIDLASHATLEAFGADLERAKNVPPEHYADGSDRVKLPSLEFRGEDETVHGVYGPSDYERLRAAALAAGAAPARSDAGPPTIEQALAQFGTMSTAEVAIVCELPGPRAPAALWQMASEWRIKSERVGSGELWAPA